MEYAMKKYICLFLSTLMFLTVFSPVNCYARDGKKVIRVGFYTMDNYQECDENGNYSGYFVDYSGRSASIPDGNMNLSR